MATLIQSKQIEGVVTASVIEGVFIVSGSQSISGPVTASTFVGDGSQLTGIDYSQIDNTPIFRAGTNVTITSGSVDGATAYTINSIGGGEGGGTSDYTQLINVPNGIISGSAQITGLGFVSSSTDISALNAFTASINSKFTTIGSQSGSWDGGTSVPAGTISGSTQLTSSFDSRYVLSGSVQNITLPSNLVSGSSQLTASYDTRYTLSGSVQNVILPSNLISSSAQITELGFVSGSYATSESVTELTISASLMTASIAGLRADVDSLASSGVPSGTISGSTQIQRLGYATTGSNQFNGNQSISGSLNVSASVTINGNLVVRGTTTSINSTTIQLGDNIIELNGRGLQHGGLLVKDADSPNEISGSLLWDSVNDRWIAGPKDNEETILLAGSDGVVSGSSQISFTELNNLPAGIVSSSDQITSSLDGVFATDADLTTFSSSIATTLESLSQSSGYINYVTNSVEQLTGIEVADFDNNTAVTFTNGVLKFIFGTPTQPSSVAVSLSGFATDRFNKVNDAYVVNATWNNQGYTIVSASLYEGSTLLANVGSGTSLSYNTTTSGSHTYQLQYTASSPLDNSLYTTSTTVSGTLSKTNPANPTLSATPSVQLGFSSNQIEQGATGSITFTSSSANPSNSWNLTSVTTNVPSPYYVTGSATGSTSISLTTTANYASPIGDNSPDLTTTTSATTTYTKIRSLRSGASATETFTTTDLANLALWDTTLGGSIGTIAKGTTTASGQAVTIAWSGDKYHYIVFDSARANLTNITTSGFGVIGQFSVTTIGQYKVYKTNTLQAGGAGSSITYVLT